MQFKSEVTTTILSRKLFSRHTMNSKEVLAIFHVMIELATGLVLSLVNDS